MAGSLRIDYQATKTTGNNVKADAGEFNALLQSIHSQNESLKKHWQGGDADSYTKKISEQEKVMNKLQSSMEEIGNYLIKVAGAYQQAMEDNKIS